MNSYLPFSEWSPDENYHGIRNYQSNRMGITRHALKRLRKHLPFTQLRFHCSKQQGRTFHVITAANSTGEAVVQFFSWETNVRPHACGSFVPMVDDNSQLASSCHLWGLDGKWCLRQKKGLYYYTVSINHQNNWLIDINTNEMKCDDNSNDVSTGDFWKIFVR